jgi:hypothetical protein
LGHDHHVGVIGGDDCGLFAATQIADLIEIEN